MPDREAWVAYAAHTRREVSSLQGTTEDVSLFILAEALLNDGGLAAAYALLPTTIERDAAPPPIECSDEFGLSSGIRRA